MPGPGARGWSRLLRRWRHVVWRLATVGLVRLNPCLPLPPSPLPPLALDSRFSTRCLWITSPRLRRTAALSFVVSGGLALSRFAAIKAKEVYEGALAAARAQAELERQGPLAPAGPVQEAQGSGSGAPPRPDSAAAAMASSQAGKKRGRPPKSASRPSTSSRARSVPLKGTNPDNVSQ